VSEPVLGVDFGRVINDGSSHPSGDDTAFLTGSEEAMLATPAMAGAFESLGRLTTLFQGRIWIVSKAGTRIQANTERWLLHHGFFKATGVPTDHLRFVRTRADKAAVCQELGMTHFVDDRAEVLQALEGVVERLYLFGPQSELVVIDAIPVPTWVDAEREITLSVR
jgi:hypothetical protein